MLMPKYVEKNRAWNVKEKSKCTISIHLFIGD